MFNLIYSIIFFRSIIAWLISTYAAMERFTLSVGLPSMRHQVEIPIEAAEYAAAYQRATASIFQLRIKAKSWID